MIRIKLVSQPQALSKIQSNQLVELHKDYLAHQRELLSEVRPGPDVAITSKLLLQNNVIACAFDSEENIVGYALFRNLTGALSIRCIYVNPMVRQKGVMTAMLDAIHHGEVYHSVSVNLPPKCEHVANYFDDAGYPKVRDINCGWVCYNRVYADSSRCRTEGRPSITGDIKVLA